MSGVSSGLKRAGEDFDLGVIETFLIAFCKGEMEVPGGVVKPKRGLTGELQLTVHIICKLGMARRTNVSLVKNLYPAQKYPLLRRATAAAPFDVAFNLVPHVAHFQQCCVYCSGKESAMQPSKNPTMMIMVETEVSSAAVMWMNLDRQQQGRQEGHTA